MRTTRKWRVVLSVTVCLASIFYLIYANFFSGKAVAVEQLTPAEQRTFDGEGVYHYSDGSIYEGDFEDGKRDGQGVMENATGWTYQGEWQDDEIQGKGKLTLKDGSVYDGEWSEGNPDGKGSYREANGEMVTSVWTVGVSNNGQVVQFDEADNLYVGSLDENQLPSGKGTFANQEEGWTYVGDFVDGLRNGYGEMIYPDGSIYKG